MAFRKVGYFMKRGRPTSDNPRIKQIHLRLTEKEWARIGELADKAGQTKSEYIRTSIKIRSELYNNNNYEIKYFVGSWETGFDLNALMITADSASHAIELSRELLKKKFGSGYYIQTVTKLSPINTREK